MSREPFDEAAAVGKVWTDTIYPSDFKDGTGRYFNIVTEEDGHTSIEYEPPYPSRNRIKITVTFLRGKGDIKEVTFKKFRQFSTRGVTRWEEQCWEPGAPMSFTHFSFEKLTGFLKLLTELDLANLDKRRIALRETATGGIDHETLEKMRSLAQQPDGLRIVEEVLSNGSLTSRDLVNIGYRKRQLQIFERLLSEEAYVAIYREEHRIKQRGEEKVWQHFFSQNEWIFGFGLDYRFLSILQQEAHVSDEDLAGRDGAITDFLMGSTDFTVLVELKTPVTPLIENSKNRAGSWRLSHDLIDAVSQILEQKARWEIRGTVNATENYNDAGGLITQKTVDPKCILIIGTRGKFSGPTKTSAIMRRSFELFRRDSRNIEIVTYDELFERAKFIVGHGNRNADGFRTHQDF